MRYFTFLLAIVSSLNAFADAPKDAEKQILEALPEKAPAAAKAKRTVLVFSKTNGFRHASIPTGHLALKLLGEKTGAFDVVASEDVAMFDKETLSKFDAVCFLSTTGEVFYPKGKPTDEEKKIGDQRKQNLYDFIKGGKGFVGIHAATDTCYQCEEFGSMINGYFDGHPWNANTDVSIKVEPGQEEHPVVAALEGKNLEFKEEIYQLKAPYSSKRAHMLLRLDTEKSDMNVKGIKRTDGDFGVSWIRPYGEGRVFYSSLGHNHHIFWNAKVLAHYLAGIQWALGDLDAPVVIPENEGK